MSERERREYHRIDERVWLHARPLASAELPAARERLAGRRPAWSELRMEVQAARREQDALLDALRPDHPVLARFLDNVERRLALLARAVMARQDTPAEAVPVTADLGASGLRFRTPLALQAGDWLELFLSLPQEGLAFEALGEVLRADPRGEGGCEVAVCFRHIHPADQECLAAYVVRAELEGARGRRPG